MPLMYGTIIDTKSKIGKIAIYSDDKYIIRLSFINGNSGEMPYEENRLCAQCADELHAYFTGSLKEFTVPFKLTGSDFDLKIWNALMKIPYGNTTTYKGIAELAGAGCARAAGRALSRNPLPVIVPCHRVIAANGSLGGFCGGTEKAYIKQALLDIERR